MPYLDYPHRTRAVRTQDGASGISDAGPFLNTDCFGGDVVSVHATSAVDCARQCKNRNDETCSVYVYESDGGTCLLKTKSAYFDQRPKLNHTCGYIGPVSGGVQTQDAPKAKSWNAVTSGATGLSSGSSTIRPNPSKRSNSSNWSMQNVLIVLVGLVFLYAVFRRGGSMQQNPQSIPSPVGGWSHL